jgi:hypothetical protein
VWYATKQAADALQSRVKAEPVWLRDARTNQDFALSVKRSRKPGMLGPNSSCMPGRQNAMTPNGIAMSSSSNSSSSLLPLMHFSGGFANDASAQLAQMQAAGLARMGSLDASMLGPDVIRLLPLQPLGGVMQQQQGMPSGYMAVDVCEAMLDASYDPAGLGLGGPMPVHLQPSIASQVRRGLRWWWWCLHDRATFDLLLVYSLFLCLLSVHAWTHSCITFYFLLLQVMCCHRPTAQAVLLIGMCSGCA